MPSNAWELEPEERSYFIDPETGARKVFSEELLTPDVIEQYFRKSLPKATEWVPGYDTHCPFHDDDKPSFSINPETGQWYCHKCCVGGNKLVSFEMQLFGLADVHEAWVRVAKKLGFKACPRSRGKATHRHEYQDENGLPQYVMLRYEDGSASFRRFTNYPFTKAGLGQRKRILYNLPNVVAADVVLITEGEKKADILTDMGLLDADGKPVAVTCTGGADSWRTEFVEHLKGKRVLLLPDADEPGQRYSSSVQASLQRVEIEHGVVEFGDYGNDFRDFLKDHEPSELVELIDRPWLCLPALDYSLSETKGEICI
jgi:putative DNA primase/helicase